MRARRRNLKFVSHHVKDKYNGEDWEVDETTGELLDDEHSKQTVKPKNISNKMHVDNCQAEVDKI